MILTSLNSRKKNTLFFKTICHYYFLRLKMINMNTKYYNFISEAKAFAYLVNSVFPYRYNFGKLSQRKRSQRTII